MKLELILTKDWNNDILYNLIRSKKKKIQIKKLEVPFIKYINPEFKIFSKQDSLPWSEIKPNIFSKDAKERFGLDKNDIFVKTN